LEGVIADVIRQLETDPRAPRLRLHAPAGRYRGLQAVSLTYEYRIILILRISRHEIVLLDVGTHDEVHGGT
jgi:mRNA-degrading endonuclease YafQ of YafQ-DinJ toxin-antitoxin module